MAARLRQAALNSHNQYAVHVDPTEIQGLYNGGEGFIPISVHLLTEGLDRIWIRPADNNQSGTTVGALLWALAGSTSNYGEESRLRLIVEHRLVPHLDNEQRSVPLSNIGIGPDNNQTRDVYVIRR